MIAMALLAVQSGLSALCYSCIVFKETFAETDNQG